MMKKLILSSAFVLASGAQAAVMDIHQSRGTVLIAAPTALNGPTNQGIWFVNTMDKSFSLELPELPANQVYESWIVDECTGQKISGGIFRAMGGVDSDATGRFAGPLTLNYPPQPGSDFVTLGQNLADGGHKVVITIEPYPDMDANPSGVAVLRATIPSGVQAGTVITFENIAQ